MATNRKRAATKREGNLTPKQEAFCLAYVETGSASEAYRKAYNTKNMKPETVHKRSSELLASGEIAGRVDSIKAEHMERHKITVDDLLKELEEARQIALNAETPQSAAAVSATMGKAKLLGMDKQILEHTGPDGGPVVVAPTVIELVAPK